MDNLTHLTFKFDERPERDTLLLPLGEVTPDTVNTLQLKLASKIAEAKDRFVYAAVLENDNDMFMLYVPEKKYSHLPHAKSALSTLLGRIGFDQKLVCDLKFMDFNALIEFGIFKMKPDVKTYYAKKQKDLGLTVENVDLEANQPDDEWEDYSTCVKSISACVTLAAGDSSKHSAALLYPSTWIRLDGREHIQTGRFAKVTTITESRVLIGSPLTGSFQLNKEVSWSRE